MIYFLFIGSLLWDDIPKQELEFLLTKRATELEEITDHFSSKVTFHKNYLPDTYTCHLIEHSLGGSYLIENRIPLYIVKPIDESFMCVNNPKQFGSPFVDPEYRARIDIPLYHSAQISVACSQIASILGLSHLTPQVELAILEEPSFFQIISDTKKKLCSIQPFIKAEPLSYLIQKAIDSKHPDQFLLNCLDGEIIEDLLLFLWVTFDNDAHMDNFLIKPKIPFNSQDPCYHLIKIDNELCFPEKNRGIINFLTYLPQAELPLSDRAIEKIEQFPLEKVCSILDFFELEFAKQALIERIRYLQFIASKEISYDQCLKLFLEAQQM